MDLAHDLARQQHQALLDQAEAWRCLRRARALARADRRIRRTELQLAERRCRASDLTARYEPQPVTVAQ